VSAELPSKGEDAELHQLVNEFMRHKETHLQSIESRCNKKGKCIYGFPHAVREQTTVNEHCRVQYRRRSPESAWIASYIPALLLLLKCHIFVDVCFTANIVLYLYKYFFKGADTTRFKIVSAVDPSPHREIDDFQIARYLSSSKAAWRILNYNITNTQPSVTAYAIHLPNKQLGQMWRTKGTTSSVTAFLRYLHQPASPEFDSLKLLDFYSRYWAQPVSKARQELGDFPKPGRRLS
jgi:hypothetical protein